MQFPGRPATKIQAMLEFLHEVAVRTGWADHIYVVGGAVRNRLMGLAPKDLDIVVDSVSSSGFDSAQFARALAAAIPVETSLVTNQYGVSILSVKGNWDLEGFPMHGEVIEVATARREAYGGEGGKGYKPHQVAPATIAEDLFRREFTVNTLMWRLSSDFMEGPEVLDLLGRGLRDLESRVLRTPQDPDRTFQDDPTRMLRAVKFQLKYGFSLEKETEEAIQRNALRLEAMPPDAVARILIKDVLAPFSLGEALGRLNFLGLVPVLRRMVEKEAPFRAFMTSEFGTRSPEELLLLSEYGLEADTPIKSFSLPERARIREVRAALPPADGALWWVRLQRPVYGAQILIDRHQLKPRERARMSPLARSLILREPGLALDPEALRLTERISEELASLKP